MCAVLCVSCCFSRRGFVCCCIIRVFMPAFTYYYLEGVTDLHVCMLWGMVPSYGLLDRF